MSSSRPRATEAGLYRHCPYCAAVLARETIRERTRPRCPACGFVQWRNPAVGVAAILREGPIVDLLGIRGVRHGLGDPLWQPATGGDRVLLVRRAGSRSGSWCLPCGYVEIDEEIREALIREMREELGLEVAPGPVWSVQSNFHDPDRQTVGVWFETIPTGGELRAGDDAAAIGFFDPASPPEPMAFPTDRIVLESLRPAP